MSGLHHAVRGQRSHLWLAALLAGGLMVWSMLLLAAEHHAATTAGLAGAVSHPAAESTPNALPRTMCVDPGNEHGSCISTGAEGDDRDGLADAVAVVVDRGYDVADDGPAGDVLVGDSYSASWKAAPVDGSRAPPVAL